MDRRNFIKGAISGAIGFLVGKIVPEGPDDTDYRRAYDWLSVKHRELEIWYHEKCYELECTKRRLAELEVQADMPYWLDEDESWSARNDQGQVFFVGPSGQDQNDGLSPDNSLSTVKEALSRCDCQCETKGSI